MDGLHGFVTGAEFVGKKRMKCCKGHRIGYLQDLAYPLDTASWNKKFLQQRRLKENGWLKYVTITEGSLEVKLPTIWTVGK